ncbi:MAG: GTPase Era [Deferribacteres bacterium]|nr:GTPase Era [Deferribacteres bacterium]
MSWAKVVILGKANVGKSTLLNSILKEKKAGVSSTPGTTANVITGERVIDGVRVFFIDTPGLSRPKDEKDEASMMEGLSEIADSDLIYLVIDAHTGITKEDQSILEKLQPLHGKVPIFLVINKIDGVPKEKLFSFIQEVSEELFWDEIIPVSAKRQTNIDELLKTTAKYIKGREGEPPEHLTKEDLSHIIQDVIREKLLSKLKRDAAKKVRVEVKEVDVGEGRIYASAFIVAEKPSIKAMVIGKKGQMIKSIGTEARLELEKRFNKKVYLDLQVIDEKRA